MANRKFPRWTIGWITIACLLLLGAVCWRQSRPGTAVIVTIDEIGVGSDGCARIAYSYAARRDSSLAHGWRELDDNALDSVDLEIPVERIGFVQRWRTGLRESAAMEFKTPHPESVEPLVERGQRSYLAFGERLPLMRIDREIDGQTVRQESFLVARDPSLDTFPDASRFAPDDNH